MVTIALTGSKGGGGAVHSCKKGESHSLPIASSQACNTITVSVPPYKNGSGSDRKNYVRGVTINVNREGEDNNRVRKRGRN